MKDHEWLGIPRARHGLAMLLLLAFGSAAQAGLSPTFSKAFNQSTIGPGSVSTLTFTITNPDPDVPRDDLAFTDMLPAAVTIATPAAAISFCGGILSAPNGGTTITFSGGMLGTSKSCTIRVNVTSNTIGTHTNTSGTLTSDQGSHGTASADLTVATDRPGFIKVFSPSSVSLGGRSTLTFTIDNTANAAPASSLDFVDNLPPGMVVANPANASTTCGSPPTISPTLTANPGSNTIILDYLGTDAFPGVAAMDFCTVTVDVIGGAVGMLGNTSGELTATVNNMLRLSGKAANVLTVTGGAVEPILLTKEFTTDPVPPGGTVNLRFVITNTSRSDSATGIAFSDDLNATLMGLTFTSLASNTCDATPTGTASTTIDFSGGSLAPEASCTFTATLSVPAGAAPGTYSNTTSTVTATLGDSPVMGSAAGDMLFVVAFPALTKEFTDDPIGAGDTVTLEFTITNTSTTSALGSISFLDELTDGSGDTPPDPTSGFLPFPVSVGLPPMPDPPCGPMSSLALVGRGFERQALELTGGSLAANDGMPGGPDTCTFSVTVDIPAGFPAGNYTNHTEQITAELTDLMNQPVTGPGTTDVLVVVGAPTLSKEFTDDPVAPGDPVTLQFTLEHDPMAGANADMIAFTDNLTTVIPGLTATAVGTNTCGGTVDITTDPTLIDFSGGGVLMPGDTCTIGVTLMVPAMALPGRFTNTTSDVTATVGGVATTGNPAEDDLLVAGLTLIKEFLNDPTIPGDTVDLRFTLDNASGTADATAIFFTDDLDAVLSGLTVASPTLPTAFCGGTLSLAGSTLVFLGGSVMAGTSCDIDLTLTVPPGSTGIYGNTTSNLSATIGGTPLSLDPAFDALVVEDELLAISKEFTDDPAQPGGTVTLDLTIVNLDPARMASMIALTDDLGAALPGLTIGSATDDCGGTLGGVTTSMLSYSGGSLAGGGTCTISLTLDVPAGPLPGDTFTNTTSDVTGTIGGFAVFGAAASDDLRVVDIELDKAFGSVGFPGQNVTLTFTITNLDATEGASNLSFSDALQAGLTAVPPLPSAPCGAGSTISGTTFLTFSGGSLGPGGMCSIPVTVQVPAAASPGSVMNTTSDLFSAGLSVSGPGTDTLIIEPPPTFAKAFAPAFIGLGQGSTLSFSIDNSLSDAAASGLAFTDNLPAGIEVAATPAVTNGCGGTVTASAGATTISLGGGSVAAGMSCMIQVNVTGTAVGALLNTTGDLTSSSGNSGTASDTLTVNPQPGFAKVFAPNPTAVGGTSTLTFTIDNSGSTVDATALDFTDPLPASVVIATPSNASTTCTGGTLTAVDGTGTISYSGGTVMANASCTVSVDTTSSTPGMHANTSGDLTSSLGISGQASDTLTVIAPPAFAKAFGPNPIVTGAVSTLNFTIDNSGSSLDATALDFTDNLPAVVVVATPSNAGTTCSGGTLTALDGSGTISYSGGTVMAGASCMVSVDTTSATPGSHVNTSGALTSSLGDSGMASDTLIVNAGPVPAFSKAFAPNPIGLGGTSTLTFTIDNSGSLVPATGLDFTDNLPAAVVVATPSNAATTCTGGTLTALDGTGTIAYAGGTVGAGVMCTVSADVVGTMSGSHLNMSGNLTSSLGDSGPASDTLDVGGNDLTLTKAFLSDPVLPGGTVDVEFTITNVSGSFDATAITFTDDLNGAIPGLSAVGLPIAACGGMLTGANGDTELTFAGGALAAGTSCVVPVTLRVPASTAAGTYTNTTSAITGTFGGMAKGNGQVPGAPASASFSVALLSFAKVFAGDVPVGGIAMLRFTIVNPDPVNGATDIGFSDDLNAFIAGAMAIQLPQTGVCGAGSTVSGMAVITLAGGSLGPSSACTFEVRIQLPASAMPAVYTNTTGPLQFSVGGAAVTSPGAPSATAVLGVGVATPVPSLNAWGLLVLIALVLMVSAARLRRAA